MIRKIIIPVRGDGKSGNVFAHAAILAHRFKAHIVVTHCRPRPEDLLPYGVPVPAFMREMFVEQSSKVADLEEQSLQEEMTTLARQYGIEMMEKPTGNTASFSWFEEAGRQVDIIKRHGRLADLICVAKPDRDRNLGANTLKAALFNTGRPVMMCPPADNPQENLGNHIAIAWNGSQEASRAIALTLDLFQKAEHVTVLTTGKHPHGASSEELIEYLAMREVKASINRFEASSNIAARLLEESKSIGADMMVMGAYGHSHERETIFGGNTQSVVDTAKMPVVMVH